MEVLLFVLKLLFALVAFGALFHAAWNSEPPAGRASFRSAVDEVDEDEPDESWFGRDDDDWEDWEDDPASVTQDDGDDWNERVRQWAIEAEDEIDR